jgi:hypothetical protein
MNLALVLVSSNANGQVYDIVPANQVRRKPRPKVRR